jgi:hypothetical protein
VDATTIWAAVTGGGTLLLGTATVWLAASTRSLVQEGKLSRAHWEAMSNEAARARLDAKAPKVELRLSPARRPFLPSAYGFAQPCPENQSWTFDRDENERLLLRCSARLINSGETSVSVRICANGDGLVSPAQSDTGLPEPRSKVMTARLQPSRAVDFTIEANYTLKDWAQGWESRFADATPTPNMLVYVEVDDGDDNGVVDWWAVLLSGTPIGPVQGNRAEWRLRPENDQFIVFVTAESRQRHRDYYLSRRARLAVPELPSQGTSYGEIDRLRREVHAELYGASSESQVRNLMGSVLEPTSE